MILRFFFHLQIRAIASLSVRGWWCRLSAFPRSLLASGALLCCWLWVYFQNFGVISSHCWEYWLKPLCSEYSAVDVSSSSSDGLLSITGRYFCQSIFISFWMSQFFPMLAVCYLALRLDFYSCELFAILQRWVAQHLWAFIGWSRESLLCMATNLFCFGMVLHSFQL